MAHHEHSETRLASREQLHTLAKGLGWFSIALGALELMAPRRVSREIGMRDQSGLVGAYGVREIATGVGILASRDPTPWIWGRVAGDVLDAVSLLPAATTPGRKQGNAMASLAAVAGVLLVDAYGACLRVGSPRLGHARLQQSRRTPKAPPRDYSSRSGFPRSPDEMRGAASKTFRTPTPTAARPFARMRPATRPGARPAARAGQAGRVAWRAPQLAALQGYASGLTEVTRLLHVLIA